MARARLDPAVSQAMQGLVSAYIRPWSGYYLDDVTGQPVFEFDPPLTAAEQATYSDLVLMARFGVSLTLAEWQSIKPDAALLRTYAGIASPTLAQTAAATKAQSRILAVIVRA